MTDAGLEKSHAATSRGQQGKKRSAISPVTLRLTIEERQRLEELAAGITLFTVGHDQFFHWTTFGQFHVYLSVAATTVAGCSTSIALSGTCGQSKGASPERPAAVEFRLPHRSRINGDGGT